MSAPVTFKAPIGKSVKWITIIVIMVIIGIPVIGLGFVPEEDLVGRLSMIILPLLIVAITSFFVVRGYILQDKTLFIQRLGWNYKIDLSGLISVDVVPEAMKGSIRTWGNGGLFCYAGYFRNSSLGSYRAFVTDPKRTVVLKLAKSIFVLSPENPEEFVSRLRYMVKS
jgi:hypothetical protein